MKTTHAIDDLLSEINNIKITHKSDRRIRLDLKPDSLPALLELIKGKSSYIHLSAISCVDWLEDKQFELVYHCWSYEEKNMISAHIRISRKEAKYVSVYDLYKPAGFFERDIYEMFGVYFIGSPHMEKFILTEWDGMPPMLKDFDAEAYVQDTFNWTDYNPEWLQQITVEGGGIAVRPDEIR
ncbi:MAG: NADH-quinone oxidoreductase subunit C [Pseudomonadota bacterium]